MDTVNTDSKRQQASQASQVSEQKGRSDSVGEVDNGGPDGGGLDGLYHRERLMSILSRVRKGGGLGLTEEKKCQFTTWFRTIATRGYATEEFMKDGKAANEAYKTRFPGPVTRAHYTRSFLVYLEGLTDAEYAKEYPSLPREDLVARITAISQDAWLERKAKKASA